MSESTQQTPTKPRVKFEGEDGNVFSIMGRCSKALKRAGQPEQAKAMIKKVRACKNYDAALQVMMGFVDSY